MPFVVIFCIFFCARRGKGQQLTRHLVDAFISQVSISIFFSDLELGQIKIYATSFVSSGCSFVWVFVSMSKMAQYIGKWWLTAP